MKNLSFAVLNLALWLVALAANGQIPKPSPAEQKIAWAQAAIKAHPERSQPYNELAMALVRRARETADASYFAPAEAAVERSLKISPDNLEGQKARVQILLGKCEFSKALEIAKALNKRAPDDVLIYGLVADADVELGDYKDAEEAVQWMLDIRPANLAGLTRGAALRKLFGDVDGAMDFYTQVYQETPPTQTEELAGILTQMADLQLTIGNPNDTEKLLHSALAQFPGYYLTLETLARVQTAKHKYAEAAELLKRRNQSAPRPASVYALAQALERAGRSDEAKAAYAEFEEKARRQTEEADNANRELVLYYLGPGHNASEALRLAKLEAMRRHDVYTLDAHAWALYANGRYAEARKQIESALAVGVRDAGFFFHAGAIALKLEDRTAAAGYLKQCLHLNPLSEFATAAREALDTLTSASAESGKRADKAATRNRR